MSGRGVRVRVLGPVAVLRDGAPVSLPRSRKVRALLAYLALESSSTAPLSRSRLCDLLWDVPNDPRGELRWCLSKLRTVLDDTARRRVVAVGQTKVALDLSDCVLDASEVERAVKSGVGDATRERLEELRGLFGGDLLEGLTLDATPEFTGWLAAQRQRFRALHVAVLGELTRRSTPDQTFHLLDEWLQLAPFDRRPHEVMLEALLRCGRAQDAEEHLATTIRAFEQQGVDWAPLRDSWQNTRRPAVELPRAEPAPPPRGARRASVAVLPFVDATTPSARIADGLTDDIITRLAKLRALFVIARGSSYALGERGIGAQEAGRLLQVDYVVSGIVRRLGERMSFVVELAETKQARIVWSDELRGVAGETFSFQDAIVDRIVATIVEEIESEECKRAIIKPPSSLDAWEAYHRGLWHMYKFIGSDNEQAARLFRSALELDPTFARAHAGLSFTHFQNVFLELTPDRDRQMQLALSTAEASVAADDRDPAAHWALGRALWLRGAQDESLAELQRSVELSPNFALGHYTLGFVRCQSGDPRAAIQATDYSRQLSPFDPLQFGMLGSRAMAHARLGEYAEAAEWGVRAAARPNAHTHILAIAASTLALAERREDAQAQVARIRARSPGYKLEDFFRAFRFTADAEKLFRRGAKRIGFQ